VVLAAASIGAALAGAAARQGLSWVMAPIVVLLGAVVLLGLLALWRSARRAAAPSHLALDAGAGVVSGFVARGTLGRMRVEPLGAVKALSLEVRRSAGADPRAPRSWATLELQLTDGTRLEGPEAWGPDAEYEQTEALLVPLGQELARLCGRPLEVTRLWTGETRLDA
jgi:hypothetical protein